MPATPSYKSVFIPADLYQDLASAAEMNRLSVGEVATILLIEGAAAVKARYDAAVAEATAQPAEEADSVPVEAGVEEGQ